MDGKHLRQYWTNEADALIATYRQFETLLPSEDSKGAAHTGEDGRYVEALVRSYLRRFLPKGLELLSGFVLRPAVKTGTKGQERNQEADRHSGQLDIIVFDSVSYPTFQRFDDSAIVPPEGVVAIISVKKTLRDGDIAHESMALRRAAELCRTRSDSGKSRRGPFLALVGISSTITKVNPPTEKWIFQQMKMAYGGESAPYFDEVVGYIGSLQDWSIFKRRPATDAKRAEYVHLRHDKQETHMWLQFLLTGILSVAYDSTRTALRRPGFTAFQPHRSHDGTLGRIATCGLREQPG